MRTTLRRLTWRIAPGLPGRGRSVFRSAGDEIIASARQGSSGKRPSVSAAIEPAEREPEDREPRGRACPRPTRWSTTALKSSASSAPKE